MSEAPQATAILHSAPETTVSVAVPSPRYDFCHCSGNALGIRSVVATATISRVGQPAEEGAVLSFASSARLEPSAAT